MERKIINILSAVALPLELFANGKSLEVATGFFIARSNEHFLITNWHVLSGRYPNTGQPRHPSGAIPDSLRIKLHHKDQIGAHYFGVKFDLLDANGSPQWLQHSKGQDFDIACIKVADKFQDSVYYDAYISHNPAMNVSVGQDVFILGFPKGMAHQRIFPVWKRGTIAAEPSIDREDELPVILVDTATREGMSGSPVYLYSQGTVVHEDGSVGVYDGFSARFLGVYSGRYVSELENEIQIGKVWKEQAIREMLDSPSLGQFQLRKTE